MACDIVAEAERAGELFLVYGSHYAIMDQYNVIVLPPQVRTYYNEMKADTDRLGITLLSPKGKQYIDLTKDPKGAVAWIEENLEA